jgi:hypothetical protein
MLKRNLNRHHADFKKFKKIITPETIAIIAASFLGKVNFTDQEAQEAIQQALNLLIVTKDAVDKELRNK